MSDRKNWWTLVLADPQGELSDADREHIAEMIEGGFTEGQIVPDDDAAPGAEDN